MTVCNFAASNCQLAELGDALMNLVEGPHCTMIDPRLDGDARAIRTKARSLVTRFEKLGRRRDALMVAVSQKHNASRAQGYHLTSRPRPRTPTKNANWKHLKKKQNNRFLQPRLALMLRQDCNAKTE